MKHPFRGEEERIVRFAREFLSERDIDLFICGHIHCAEVYPLDERTTVVVRGEWIESPTYGVLSEKGFELKSYETAI